MKRFFATARRYLRLCWISLKAWLRNEPKNFEESFYLTINCWLAMSGWALVALTILNFAGLLDRLTLLSQMSPANVLAYAFLEEVGFRLVFLGPLLFFWRKLYLPVLLTLSIISSIAFGLAHGSYYNLLLQGVGGFILCLFFIKAATVHDTTHRIC